MEISAVGRYVSDHLRYLSWALKQSQGWAAVATAGIIWFGFVQHNIVWLLVCSGVLVGIVINGFRLLREIPHMWLWESIQTGCDGLTLVPPTWETMEAFRVVHDRDCRRSNGWPAEMFECLHKWSRSRVMWRVVSRQTAVIWFKPAPEVQEIAVGFVSINTPLANQLGPRTIGFHILGSHRGKDFAFHAVGCVANRLKAEGGRETHIVTAESNSGVLRVIERLSFIEISAAPHTLPNGLVIPSRRFVVVEAPAPA